MRVSLISFILNFVKCWFMLLPFYERYRRVHFLRKLYSIANKGPLGSGLILWYPLRGDFGFYAVRGFFQLFRFLLGLPSRIALLSFLFFQFAFYFLMLFPRMFVSLFVYVFNVTTFSFFFITSQLFMLFDILQLFVTVFAGPVAAYLKLWYYKALSFMVRNNSSVALYFIHSALFWLMSFIAVAATLSLLFYRSDIFVGFSHYDLGLGKLDVITHGLVGHWYRSNWWYFRIWVLYATLYFVFPGLRDSIIENFKLIKFFLLFIVICYIIIIYILV